MKNHTVKVVPKERVDKLSDPDITGKEYNNIIEEINNRVYYIWRALCRISGRNIKWWAFSNDVDLGHGNGSTGGEFDPITYKEFVRITGEFDWGVQ